jgi:hypothetical protein
MRFVVEFMLSEHITTQDFSRLKGEGLGKLKVAAGAPVSNRSFFKEKMKEDDSLPGSLLTTGAYEDYDLKIPDHVAGPKTGWVMDWEIPLAIHIKVNAESQGVAGFLLQWSDVREFTNQDNVVLMMSLAEIQ